MGLTSPLSSFSVNPNHRGVWGVAKWRRQNVTSVTHSDGSPNLMKHRHHPTEYRLHIPASFVMVNILSALAAGRCSTFSSHHWLSSCMLAADPDCIPIIPRGVLVGQALFALIWVSRTGSLEGLDEILEWICFLHSTVNLAQKINCKKFMRLFYWSMIKVD